MMNRKVIACLTSVFVTLTAYAGDTPTMGWSSWNTYHVDISDSLICSQAEAMVRLGLKALGYQYVNIDDGFFGGRYPDGTLKINTQKFPRGMKPVADHIHSLGLKAGIYSDAGHNTCGSQYDGDTLGIGVGLYRHEAQDARLFFRDWGYDFIKIDYCGAKVLNLDEREQYTRIRQAIDGVGRKDVRINVCRWAFPGTWVSEIGSSWRIFADIRPRWSRIREIIEKNLYMSAYAVDGHFNDMDMLEISRGLSPEEEQTHMATWCIMSSPLLIGCDLNKIKPASLALLKNERLLAINQDRLCRQAEVVSECDSVVLLAKDIKENAGLERAFAVVNLSDRQQAYTVEFDRQLLLGGKVVLTNAVTGEQSRVSNSSLLLTLPPHATHIFTARGTQRLPQQRYEAENAWLNNYQDIRAQQCTTIKDGYAVNLGGTADSWMEWRDIMTQNRGQHHLTIRYRSEEPRQLTLTVNGRSQAIDCPAAKNGGEVATMVMLRKGSGNTIRIGNKNAQAPDIDYITVKDAQVRFGQLTVEGRGEVLGLDEPLPRFGWQIISGMNNTVQQSYRLLIASDASLCEAGKADVWDSQTVMSDQSQWVEYGGKPLHPDTYYYWRVMIETNHGKATSKVSRWSTGLFVAANSQFSIFNSQFSIPQWIGLDSLTPDVKMERHSRIAARYFHKDFTLTKKVRRATAHVCGLGYYTFRINGKRVGNYLLAPAPTQFDKAVIYNTYDVTHLLDEESSSAVVNSCVPSVASEHSSSASLFTLHSSFSIDISLGGGYFFPMTQNHQMNVKTSFGMPKMWFAMKLEYEDGTQDYVVSDSTWRVAVDGPIRWANLYDGEMTDLRMKPTHWQSVQLVEAPAKEMRGNKTGGVVCYQETHPRPVREGVGLILDFGTNNAGRIFLSNMTIPDGDTVRIRYAEQLKIDGTLYTDNLRSSENTDYWIGNGQSVDLTTEFLWHGFRYAEVTGLSEEDCKRIVRQSMSDNFDSFGTIAIDEGEGMINRIMANARRGILDNYKGIPMDCPQRDERMPWTGDRTMGCYGESYVCNNHALYAKWLRDICDAQRENGQLSDVMPAYWRLYNSNVTWPAVLPFGMEMLRLQYGDTRPMRQHFDNVKLWLAYVKKKSGRDGLITYDRYGDWCVPPASLNEVLTKDSARLTDGALISSAYYYHICRLMAQWAEKTEDTTYFREEAETTREAINRKFLHDGTYANGTVTANLLPLALGIVPDGDRAAVQENFMRRVRGSSGEAHIDCGVIGISWLMRYLSRAGLGETAYRIASTKTYPGWGYMVENGATTIWELWNGNTANPSMNSGNHVMLLGDLIPWCYECLAGIAPDTERPGFKHIVMQPDFSVSDVRGVSATHPSVYGDITSHWHRDGSRIVWSVSIPANTTATLRLPDGETVQVGSGNHTFTR